MHRSLSLQPTGLQKQAACGNSHSTSIARLSGRHVPRSARLQRSDGHLCGTGGTPLASFALRKPSSRRAGPLHTTTSPSSSVRSSTETKTRGAKPTETFDWHKQWYPLIPIASLDRTKPLPFVLLGQPLVVYYDRASDDWNVLEDRCPHRLAPLSDGRIEPSDGTLQCSYHGWRFDSKGKTIAIPQITDPAALSTACSSGRSCAKKYPHQVQQGMLWVWAEAGPTAALESRTRAPAICPELDDPGWTSFVNEWFYRDLPLSIDIMLENLFDPSHIPFAHHGIMGTANRDLAVPLDMTTVQEVAPQAGFSLWRESAPYKTPNRTTSEVHFLPPTVCRSIQTNTETGRKSMLQFWATPLRPGWTRLHTAFASSVKLPPAAAALVKLAGPLLTFWFHRGQNLVLDSDGYILHHQEKLLRAEGNSWRRSFYLPASADLGVVKYRTWFHDMAGGGVPWPINVEPESRAPLPREVVMDRFSQHTKNCKQCMAALVMVQRAQVATGVLAVMAVGALGWQAAAGTLLTVPGGLLVAAAALATAAAWKLQQLKQEFYYTGYSHADAV